MTEYCVRWKQPKNEAEAIQMIAGLYAFAFYAHLSDIIYLNYMPKLSLRKIIKVVSHESLHEALFKVEGLEASGMLDNYKLGSI